LTTNLGAAVKKGASSALFVPPWDTVQDTEYGQDVSMR